MEYAKPRQICIRSGIDYNDLENEINRLQIEHRSAENEHKLAQEKLDKLLETDGWDKSEFKGASRDVKKSSRRLRYLSSLLHNRQMVKEGIIPLPKPNTDRAWSDDPIFDMYLEEQHRKRKEMGEDAWEKYMEERMREEDAWY
jgi:endonuclease YncB( thermonuclease family)